MSPVPVEPPVVNKKFYNGTNRMKWFGPIVFLPFEAKHHCMLKWKVKKDCFSTACKASCKVGGAGPEGVGPQSRSNEKMEPLAYHALPLSFWLEFIHCFNIGAIFDYTPAGGIVAEAAIEAKINYYGLCQTETHQKELHKHLVKRTWAAMMDGSSSQFVPALAKLMATEMVQQAPTPKGKRVVPPNAGLTPPNTAGMSLAQKMATLLAKTKAAGNAGGGSKAATTAAKDAPKARGKPVALTVIDPEDGVAQDLAEDEDEATDPEGTQPAGYGD